MKKIILGVLILSSTFTINAQVTSKSKQLKPTSKDSLDGWTTGGFLNLTLGQSQYYNWSAGGINSISANGLANFFANYKKGNSIWENDITVAYGILKQGGDDDLLKTDDKIELNSKYGQKASKNWYYATLLNFKTQMGAGYDYPDDSNKISDLLAPAYGVLAIGMDYEPSESFSLFIAPISGKVTYVNNQKMADAGSFGVEAAEYNNSGERIKKGEQVRVEFGGYLKFNFKKEILKNVDLQTQLELFSNYLDNPQNIDVDWTVLINLKINKYLSANINTELIYDDDVRVPIGRSGDGILDRKGPRTQFKEVIGLGIAYKF